MFFPGKSIMKKKWIWLASSVFLILIIYYPCLLNDFVSWDDSIYIISNKLIRHFSISSLHKIFTRSFEGHYHPLTLISLGVDYQIFGLKPYFFHLHNIILHMANAVLVFLFIRKLTGKTLIAGICMIMFAVHPMNVEAVAWATARKDVLFAFFFLLSLLMYLNYSDTGKKKYFVSSFILFILSCLSKGQGVLLPLCLIITDYFRGHNAFKRKMLPAKLPFFAVAVIFGIIAILSQQKTGYVDKSSLWLSYTDVFIYPPYILLLYIYKTLIPVNLTAYYAYPSFTDNGAPWYLWLLLPSLLAFFYFFYRKISKNKYISFGLLFFLVNIFIFLKWIPISNYIIADRYIYISGIGIFFIIGYFAEWLITNKPKLKIFLYLLIPLFLFQAVYAHERAKVWNTSMSLLNDILSKNPNAYTALNCRGDVKREDGDIKGALEDFNRAIKLHPHLPRAYANRGYVYFQTGELNRALSDLNKAISLGPVEASYFNNRGLIKEKLENCYEAITDFNRAIQFDPSMETVWFNRAHCKNLNGDFGGAIEDLKKADELGFNYPTLYFEKGFALYNLYDFNQAIENFSKVIKSDSLYADAYAYRGFAEFNNGNFMTAVTDLDKSIKLNPSFPLSYGMRGLAKIKGGYKNEEACEDFRKALSLGLTQVQKEIDKYCGNTK